MKMMFMMLFYWTKGSFDFGTFNCQLQQVTKIIKLQKVFFLDYCLQNAVVRQNELLQKLTAISDDLTLNLKQSFSANLNNRKMVQY